MEFILICVVTFFASALTLFSGFGLGTILMPVFVLFFKVDIAIAMTAVVHLFNNFFKLALLGRLAEKRVVLIFGIPAAVAAFWGAQVLFKLDHLPAVFGYSLGLKEFFITPLKFSLAIIVFTFVLLETWPKFGQLKFDQKYLPWGGILSGFFGGLSGHQGAFRSVFLVKCGLSKESFIATGVVVACLVDLVRLAVYGQHSLHDALEGNVVLVIAAVIAAFIGVLVSNRLLKKITLIAVQRIVSGMLILIAVLLGAGII